VYNGLAGTSVGVAGASVQITTGPNSGRVTTADSSGHYRLDSLIGGNMSVRIQATNYFALLRDIVVSSDSKLDFAMSPTIVMTSGRVVDAVSQLPLPSVTISGGPTSLQSDLTGAFSISAIPGAIASPLQLAFAGPSSVPRQTSILVPGKDAVVSLIASTFDLASFDQMFRTPELNRWTTAPPLAIETSTGQFEAQNSHAITAISDSMSDAEYASIVADLTTALSALSGNTFTAFPSVSRQSSPPGTVVNVLQDGVITVMRVRGMDSAINAVGLGSCLLLSDGTVVGGMVLVDRDYDQNRSGFGQQVRQHELGHAMGYNHVTLRDSVMNPTTGPNAVINDADRLGARVAFERPPGNRTPDIDPSAFTTNILRGVTIKGPERDTRPERVHRY
jgi:hypothetical protein